METEILFRCDAGKVPETGTGHLFRAISISQIFKKKFNLRKQQIKFIIKNENKYKISPKILKKNNIHYKKYNDKLLKENSSSEINILKNSPAKILIIDRLGNTKKNTILKIKKYFSKIILFDDKCKHHEYDYKINCLINSILIIDDDKRLRELLEDYLLEKKFVVYLCDDFKSAKEILEYFLFDFFFFNYFYKIYSITCRHHSIYNN